MSWIRAFFQPHPALRDAIRWAIPAIIFGFVLRAMLTAYQPMAYWGSDSESYFSFSYRLLNEGVASIPIKRRILYPIFLLPVTILPGSPLKWLPIIQHGIGLLTLIPLAYCVRKAFVGWRWWVVPITVVYTGMPIVLWFEHELLAEGFFFATFIWVGAAWFSWADRVRFDRPAAAMWWLLVAVLAVCMWTKPAGRFLLPGILVGLVYLRAWRHLKWLHWTGLAGVSMVAWSLGERDQASRLLFTSAFPLTVLDSPLHADLKAEIAPQVRASRQRLDYYYLEDAEPKRLLAGGFREGSYPAWQALDASKNSSHFEAMREMGKEAIVANPHLFLYIAAQRTVGAINWPEFKLDHFEGDYFPRRFESLYDEMTAKKSSKGRMLQVALGMPVRDPAPPYSEVRAAIPNRNLEPLAGWIKSYVSAASRIGVFTALREENGVRHRLWELTPTWPGWWLIAGILLSFAGPAQVRATLGVWLVITFGYLVGVHLLGSSYPRFFAAAWPPLFMAMAAPADLLYGLVRRVAARS